MKDEPTGNSDTVTNPLKFQHVTLVNMKTEEDEHSKPVAVDALSQDETDQLEEQQRLEDAVRMTSIATQEESTMLMIATLNNGF